MSWLQKYDLEIGDKQRELDELTGMFEDEVKKCAELEVYYHKMRIIYYLSD